MGRVGDSAFQRLEESQQPAQMVSILGKRVIGVKKPRHGRAGPKF
jgi:hypothetical protein